MKSPIGLAELKGFEVFATDGPIGKVRDFYFDDSTWKIKYIVVHTNKLSKSRDVLIMPRFLEKAGQWTSTLMLNITRDQVEKAPDTDTDMPVSRQHELALSRHYGADVYFSWGEGLMGSHNWDLSAYDFPAVTKNSDGKEFDPHLFSVKATTGAKIDCPDGKCGHVRDFIIDGNEWVIRFLVVDLGTLFETKRVLVSPLISAHMNGDGDMIELGISKMSVMDSPDYEPSDLDVELFDQRVGKRGK
jgi:sporulation protein YlmC with PRC-barrel domain